MYVLSNNHVVGDADEISIRLHDGREFEGRIVGKDERTDLALLSFEAREDVRVARLGDSDALDVGDWVLAVGNPFGFESTVTVGIVSALRRTPQPGATVADFTDYIQTDAAINPSNSGGALVNLDGEVVGINTWIASRSGGSVGLGFAIPVNNAKRAVGEFVETGRVRYGWLGVTIGDVDTESQEALAADLGIQGRSGSLVTNVIVDSPADRYGVLPGDYVTSVDGQPIANSRSLSREIGLKPAESRVTLELIRDGREMSVRVLLSERSEREQDTQTVWPGFVVAPLTDEIRDRIEAPPRLRGVVVAGVAPESPAAVGGFRPGDVVTAVSDEEIRSVREFYRELNAAGSSVDFAFLRSGMRLRVGIEKE